MPIIVAFSSSEQHFQHYISLRFSSVFRLACNSLSEKGLRALLCNYLHPCSILKEVFYFPLDDWASHLQKCVGLLHRRVNSVNSANTVWRLCSCKSPRKQDSETAIILAQVSVKKRFQVRIWCGGNERCFSSFSVLIQKWETGANSRLLLGVCKRDVKKYLKLFFFWGFFEKHVSQLF